jgi:hypothetical protein
MVEKATDAASAAICAARAVACPGAPRNILSPQCPARVVGPDLIGNWALRSYKIFTRNALRISPVAFAQQSRQTRQVMLRQVIMRVLGLLNFGNKILDWRDNRKECGDTRHKSS